VAAGKSDSKLQEYRRKRDPAKTPEPVPAGDGVTGGSGNTFVIQEHHARSLHWDLRLERDGVLVSWAVPRGLPPDPATNHLAVHTEDHPMEYAEFSGEIPQGEYGGGTMTIWDRGTYETEKWSDREVKVVLHGDRTQGRFVLFQTDGKNWMVHRMDGPVRPDWRPLPEALRPMHAVPGTLPRGRGSGGWAFETDWAGVRALAYVEGGRVRLVSGDGDDLSSAVPELRGLGESLGLTQVLLDGVLVAFDDERRPDVERLRTRLRVARDARAAAWRTPIVYLAFDLLHLDGRPLLDLPYAERRDLLEGLELGGAAWQVSPSFTTDGKDVLAAARDQGLPGIVAKRTASPYRPGTSSEDWRAIPAR
jgi:bifunctional non-homologous end joining protein LigD